jgi:WD40 repeat protein
MKQLLQSSTLSCAMLLLRLCAHPAGAVTLLSHAGAEVVPLLQFGEGKLSSAALFASSSADGTVRVWSARCWSCLAILACQGPDHSLPLLATVMSDKYALGILSLFCLCLRLPACQGSYYQPPVLTAVMSDK